MDNDFHSQIIQQASDSKASNYKRVSGTLDYLGDYDNYVIFLANMPAESPRLQKLTPEQQDTYKRAIRSLLDAAGEPNWDGEGAEPATRTAVDVALKVVEELPADAGLPEISADPEGSVEFNWYLDNGTMFTISIGRTGDIAISGLGNEKSKLTGMQWDSKGEIHSLLHCGLGWLSGMQER